MTFEQLSKEIGWNLAVLLKIETLDENFIRGINPSQWINLFKIAGGDPDLIDILSNKFNLVIQSPIALLEMFESLNPESHILQRLILCKAEAHHALTYHQWREYYQKLDQGNPNKEWVWQKLITTAETAENWLDLYRQAIQQGPKYEQEVTGHLTCQNNFTLKQWSLFFKLALPGSILMRVVLKKMTDLIN